MLQKNLISTDVLIIGSGMAGNTAALELSDKKIKTILATKSRSITESNTKYAQGGIIYKGKGDSELLIKDILHAGANFSNHNSVEILAGNGPTIIKNVLMKKLEIEFTRDNNGNIHLTQEAAHSCRRIIHIKDCTGKIIERAFIKYLKKSAFIDFYTNATLIDLITFKNKGKKHCAGAYILDNSKNEVKAIFAKKVILATGGVGKLYSRTANSEVATGDGLAASFRAGAKIKNAEFVQFHPTSLYSKNSEFLISEALRGEGAKLKSQDGDAFIQKYDDRGELAPRDIVTRAIFWELTKSRKKYALLDARDIPKGKIKSHFSNIYKTCLKNGINITKEPIPVSPTAHYFCGGVKVDGRGRTNIKNLYAIGEVSCTGVHGANRLASTSLLECLVWGHRAAKDISLNIEKHQTDKIKTRLNANNFSTTKKINLEKEWTLLKNIMWNYVGIIRTRKNLLKAVKQIGFLHKKARIIFKQGLNKDIISFYNGTQAALIIAKAALHNKQSQGCHYLDK